MPEFGRMVKAPGPHEPASPFQKHKAAASFNAASPCSFASDPFDGRIYEMIWFFGSYQVFHAVAAGPIFG